MTRIFAREIMSDAIRPLKESRFGRAIARSGFLFATVFGLTTSFACRQAPPRPESTERVVAVADLERDPAIYRRKVVTVSGCYVDGFERVTLEPCRDSTHSTLIWIADAKPRKLLSSMRWPSPPEPTPAELQVAREPEFVFTYDESANELAWKRLCPTRSTHKKFNRCEVIVRGQFDTIVPDEPKPMRVGFGHSNGYRHELILVEVLESKPLP